MTMTEPTALELAADVAMLRAELVELRRQLATEIRTRRLVIDDHECEALTVIDTRASARREPRSTTACCSPP